MVQIAARTRIDPDIAAAAKELLLAGYGPSAVDRMLTRRYPDDRRPRLRWIKAQSAALRAEPAQPWLFMESEPSEAAAVLPVLGAVIVRTEGRTRVVTKAEADVIRRVRTAAPDVPPWTAYLIARQLLVASPEDKQLLVEFMATAPWRYVERYETPAEAAGLIPHDEGAE